ncbi:L-seryl-tRNA(Sec) kinase isoform X2 [Schistocerca gregaria]|uniref:L-seryl-tRNA(Sec) kinase isoform X2 n=1 Tax=Schistocerca gregaria TaxID=7010 RepID=UPI00211E9DD5|nr:L-seryl-tRNA(Sec) kinase isoform X2 [Schistocerca gregaria]XP_049826942.1 L-seryl-tRNA(Sec) kinase isoform X2 [Schistocerca gregaria]
MENKESEIVLLILLGLPASGKTTLSKVLMKLSGDVNVSGSVGEKNHSIIHICYDALVPLLSLEQTKWSETRKKVVVVVENIICLLKTQNYSELDDYLQCMQIENTKRHISQTTNETTILLIDDNMYYSSMRYEYFKMARKYTISFAEICLHCSAEVACSRNSQRSDDRVAQGTIIRMAGKLCCPNKKNSWEKWFCCLSSESPFDERDAQAAFQVIGDSLKEPVLPMNNEDDENAHKKCAPNLIHEADIALRKVIGSKIKQLSASTAAAKNKKSLILKKQLLLQELKSGVLEVPEVIYKMFETRSDELQEELQQWWLTFFMRNV